MGFRIKAAHIINHQQSNKSFDLDERVITMKTFENASNIDDMFIQTMLLNTHQPQQHIVVNRAHSHDTLNQKWITAHISRGYKEQMIHRKNRKKKKKEKSSNILLFNLLMNMARLLYPFFGIHSSVNRVNCSQFVPSVLLESCDLWIQFVTVQLNSMVPFTAKADKLDTKPFILITLLTCKKTNG